ncbi:TRAP transporter small permease [uncultured Hoeflea sp.]|uniref:TRAP transporter small permease subunit n=1 Tax=uncultured Hoeflea sp. TaxID=538666 RepID=UPI0030DCB4C5
MIEPLPQRVSRWLAWVAGAVILFGCAVPITIDVLARYFLNRGLVESFEISGYGLAACIGLGLGYTVTTKAHIRVDFVVAKMPFPVRAACDLLAACALAVVAAALAWFAWGTVSQSWNMGARSMSQLQIPIVIPQGLWWIGLFWFACMAVLTPIQAVLRLLKGDRAGFQAAIGSADLNAEIDEAVHAVEDLR